jgi:hypothetical protein
VITPSFAGWAHVTPFALHSASQFRVEPGEITRSFESLSEASSEAADARVFAGIHFRSGCRLACG